MRTWMPGALILALASSLMAQNAARDDYNYAAGLHDRGLHDRAVRAFEDYLGKWPRDGRVPKARFYLGESLIALGRTRDALPHFVKSAGSDHPLRPEARLRAGELLHRAGKDKEAIPHLSAVVKTEGARDALREAALYFLAESHVALGQRRQGREAYGALLQAFGNGTYAVYAESALGFLAFEDGKHDDALRHFLRVVRAGDGELAVEARVMIGECHLARAAAKEALAAFSSVGRETAGRFGPQVALGVLRAQLALRRLDDAIGSYDAFRSAWPEDSRGHAAMIRCAAELHREGKDEDGLRVIQAVKGASGKEARDHAYWSGLLLTKTGRIDDAIDRLRKAVAEDPSPQRKFSLADALSQKGSFEEAAALFSQARKESRDDQVRAEAGFGEAFALNRIGKHEQAVTLLEGVRRVGASTDLTLDATFALAENLFTLKRYQQARAHYAALLEEKELPAGRREACLYKMGWCDYQEKAHDRAIQVLGVLVRDHPKSSFSDEAYYLIGKCHEAEGRDAEARAAFDTLTRSGSDKSLGVKALLGAAASAHRSKDLAAAADAYRRAVRGAQDAVTRGTALAGLGDVLSDDGKHDQAESVYAEVLARHRDHPRAESCRLGRAWALRHLGRHDEAIKVIAPLADSTDDPALRGEALWLHALEYSAKPQWPKVIALLERFDERCPGHARGPEARLLLGISLAREGADDRAISVFSAIAKEGKGAVGHASALYELGFLFEKKKADERRDQVFARLVSEHPDCAFVPDALFRLGESAYASGAWPEALARYRALADHEAVGALRDKALYKAAWCLKQLSKPADAAAAFQLVADLESPLAAESCFLAAEQHHAASNHEDAATWFGRMVERHGDHELARESRLRRVLSLRELGKWEAVVAEAPRALEAEGEGPWALRVRSALGDAFFERRAFGRCRAAYREVTKTDGELAARAQYRIGRSYEEEGDGDKAIDELLKVSILYGHPTWIAKASLRSADLLAADGQAEKARRLYEEVVKDHGGSAEAQLAQQKLSAMQKGGDQP